MNTKRVSRRKRAFTAVELTMVAAIIAIISLLVIPVLRRRTDMARVSACRAEMKSFATAQTLAQAETGHYYRLFDLSSSPEFDMNDNNYIRQVPLFDWKGREFTNMERRILADNWEGPYVEFEETAEEKYMYFQELLVLAPYYFFDQPAHETRGNTIGGIYYDGGTVNDFARAMVPLDPWGNPYFFFGPESGEETTYHSSIIWSLGPDGIVGDKDNDTNIIENPDSYRRNPEQGGQFGQGDSDDISHKF